MKKLLEKYQKLVLKTNPSTIWKVLRFVLNWISIPLKLVVLGALGVFGIAYNRLRYKKRPPEPRNLSLEAKKTRLKKIFKTLPALKNELYDLYLPRSPFTYPLNGANHSPDHQALRNGIYVFLMSKLGKRTPQMENALCQMIQGNQLVRGYVWDYKENKFIYNKKSVSGDMLIGMCLAMLDTNLANESQSMLLEKFDQLVSGIIDNDYSLLEGQEPTEEPYKTFYKQELKNNDMREEKVKLKSSRAMWQPGLETVGAQALTLLAALKVNAQINKSRSSEKEYWSMFLKNGYALLSLLPTVYLPKRRGYFNDANCIQALYVLLKLSTTKVEKTVYKFALRYVFNLSKKWYNSYFTGLVKDVAPDLVSEKYLEEVREYLYEEDPIVYCISGTKTTQNFVTPAPLSLLSHSEFAYGDKLDNYALEGERYWTGLSELAAMVLLEPDLEKIK